MQVCLKIGAMGKIQVYKAKKKLKPKMRVMNSYLKWIKIKKKKTSDALLANTFLKSKTKKKKQKKGSLQTIALNIL